MYLSEHYIKGKGPDTRKYIGLGVCISSCLYGWKLFWGVEYVVYPDKGVIAWVIHLSKVIVDFIAYKFYLIKIVLKFCAF